MDVQSRENHENILIKEEACVGKTFDCGSFWQNFLEVITVYQSGQPASRTA